MEPSTEQLKGVDVPKYEFRGVWIATVGNLDWPETHTMCTIKQRETASALLDSLQSIGINAVFFQVRPEGDAFYASTYEPWSYWLTGEQGRAPEPFYDPLFFMIREAHKRGMELHAWLNPFRVARIKGQYQMTGNHVTRRHPDWVLSFPDVYGRSYAMLNPGLPEVRDYIASIVADIVRRYDVDGIHFDDYFYPYQPIHDQDSLAFIRYGSTFDSPSDWRRESINQLIHQVNDSLNTLAPDVVFGISPFAIRKNSDAGTNGLEGYHVLFADGLAWLENRSVDYIAPQLYFEPGNERADYVSLLEFWASAAFFNDRHLYAGLAPYRLMPPHDWSRDQAARQLLYNAQHEAVQGNIFFRAQHLVLNPKGYSSLLANSLYRRPALTPVMPWRSTQKPPAVSRLQIHDESFGLVRLEWACRDPFSFEERAMRHAVYRVDPSSPLFESLSKPDVAITPEVMEAATQGRYLIGITGTRTFSDRLPYRQRQAIYLVTSVSRNSIESDPVRIFLNRDTLAGK
ncbi:family 10 glycosylhydrolase [Balneolaceae bacterium ANBcel3]|nr:family 10 glycosylhydrolase [Balneolaceae bacterium ANBcel3]